MRARLAGLLLCATVQAGAAQQPFICRAQEAGLGQPLVDNHDGIGHPVFDADGKLAGHSRDCRIAVREQLFYYNGSHFKPYDPSAPPADLRQLASGQPFVVRVEAGTINRFLYTIATLEPTPGQRVWNHKLIYWLRGGVGIGHQQGTPMWFNDALNGSERAVMPRLLEQGYAVASSTGNETGVHYNMQLAAQTAMLTKQHFSERYGKPLRTIAIGGSGGAVQQYLFSQNQPGLIDAGIPIQSYPDMVTQTIPISDCPLLGQYFADEVARDPASPWAQWSRQALVEGMNASDTAKNGLSGKPGSTECINGWRMAMPTVLNPFYRDARFDRAVAFYKYPPTALESVKWTHWNDLADIYGSDSRGFAPISVDNVGVQYGLAALRKGGIDTAEFLRLNACVGGWKEQADFVPWEQGSDPFDARNMLRSATCREPDGTPAPRRAGSAGAIAAAWASGHVFSGRTLGIPVIDLRPYLEPELNMHNARQSFSVRARLQAAGGPTARQVVWFTRSEADLVPRALQALAVLERQLDGKAPAEFTDACWDTGGTPIAAGPQVWDGILDTRPAGACTRAFPVYASPRMVAGESIRGDVFKCALKPVDAALADGSYGPVTFTAPQQAWLRRIFPQGVCDYASGKP